MAASAVPAPARKQWYVNLPYGFGRNVAVHVSPATLVILLLLHEERDKPRKPGTAPPDRVNLTPERLAELSRLSRSQTQRGLEEARELKLIDAPAHKRTGIRLCWENYTGTPQRAERRMERLRSESGVSKQKAKEVRHRAALVCPLPEVKCDCPVRELIQLESGVLTNMGPFLPDSKQVSGSADKPLSPLDPRLYGEYEQNQEVTSYNVASMRHCKTAQRKPPQTATESDPDPPKTSPVIRHGNSPPGTDAPVGAAVASLRAALNTPDVVSVLGRALDDAFIEELADRLRGAPPELLVERICDPAERRRLKKYGTGLLLNFAADAARTHSVRSKARAGKDLTGPPGLAGPGCNQCGDWGVSGKPPPGRGWSVATLRQAIERGAASLCGCTAGRWWIEFCPELATVKGPPGED